MIVISKKSIVKKPVNISSLFFGGPAYFAQPFAGMETGGLELQPFDFFGGSDINVIFDSLAICYAVM
jgi:hypothetical protein